MTAGPQQRVRALDPAAAVAGWLAVVVVLNVTSHPLVVAGALAGGVWFAVRARLRVLLIVAACTGIGLLFVLPGFAVADGSFRFTYAMWERPGSPVDWLLALVGAGRVPAQVLAAGLLAAVPGDALLTFGARRAPRAALLAGLAARLRPLLRQDLVTVRDELASSGLAATKRSSIEQRVRVGVAIWEAAVSGLFDRAAVTAASLRVRGYGASARTTTEPMRHPHLMDHRNRSVTADRALLITAGAAIVCVTAGRVTGQIGPPVNGVLAGFDAPMTPLALVTGLLLAAVLVIPGLASATPPPHADPLPAPDDGSVGSSAPLAVRGVGVRYPERNAAVLSGIDLDIAPGELVLLTGASGSGKSSLLGAICGVVPEVTGGSLTGTIRLGDLDLTPSADGSASGAGRVTAVFQQPESQVIVGRVAEEVAFGLRQAGVPIANIEQRVLETLESLGIGHLAHRDCATLSGGELQRVILAAALAPRPALLVLDEPTSQLDPAGTAAFWAAVDRARAAWGTSVLVAEHRVRGTEHLADRVLALGTDGVLNERAGAAATAGIADELDPFAGLAPVRVVAGARLDVAVPRLAPSESAPMLARDVRLVAGAGSIVALTGPNGSGKTTLLRDIRGLGSTDARISIDGSPRGTVGASVRQLGWMGQTAGAMVSGRTVHEAAAAASVRLGTDPGGVAAALAAAGLGDRLDAHPSELSVGERQRLCVLAATAHRPAVWLLDEPTRGMDDRARRWFAMHVLAHAASGGVVMIATHDEDLVQAVATTRLELDVRSGPRLSHISRGVPRTISPASPLPGGVR